MMKRVLVTGASGFVGYQCLVPLVAKGYEVHAVARSPHRGDSSSIHWHEADLMDARQAHQLVSGIRPSHLLHSAWYLEPGAFYHSPKNFDWVQASIRLLQTFREFEGGRCVMVGTGYEYDLGYGYCVEGLTPCRPSTIYGQCKDATRRLLEAYSDTVHLSTAWARIFFLYGPREYPSRLVASIAKSLLQGKPAPCSNGEQIRDYLHVQDAAEALVSILDGDVEGPVNVGSGRPITIREIVDTTAEIIERQDLIRPGEIPDDPNSPPLIVANVSRLREEVGWQPRFNLDEGLRDTVEWWAHTLNIKANA
jgi:nucleoside-diphosphate-sugar epimerase